MAIECAGNVGVDAPAEVCLAHAADVERWPEWARDLERVSVLERDGHGRPVRADLVADLFGKEFTATVDFRHGETDVAFELVEARKLAAFAGSLRFEPDGGGATMTFQMSMVLVKPKAPRIERMVGRKIETALSRDLRRHIERNLARRR